METYKMNVVCACGQKTGLFDFEVEAFTEGWLGVQCRGCHNRLNAETATLEVVA